jgi:hypothetical protein
MNHDDELSGRYQEARRSVRMIPDDHDVKTRLHKEQQYRENNKLVDI